jgi:hypothetical protein
VPDQSLIVENNLNPADRIQATRGRDYGFVYTSSGLPFTVNPGLISGKLLTANWFDPRTGKTRSAGTFANQRPQRFTPPDRGYGHDWVLILDDTAKNYSLP